MISEKILSIFFPPKPRTAAVRSANSSLGSASVVSPSESTIGLISGNGPFPLRFVEEAKRNGRAVYAICHQGETDPALEQHVEKACWIKVGELGKMISFFRDNGLTQVAMAGGINRVKHFGSVKLDARGAALMLRLRSTKDDVIMRGIADELLKEGVEVIPSTVFLSNCLAREGVLTRSAPTTDEEEDIRVGIEAIKAMSSQDIGQLVVVREGVIVAVEAAEGTNATILRGGELGGKGTVVVKFAKLTQDMRFDVPVIGLKTIDCLVQSKARVLAVEAGRCLMMDEEEVVKAANKNKIAIVGCPSLVVSQSLSAANGEAR